MADGNIQSPVFFKALPIWAYAHFFWKQRKITFFLLKNNLRPKTVYLKQ